MQYALSQILVILYYAELVENMMLFVEDGGEKKVKVCKQSVCVMQKQAKGLEIQRNTGHNRKVSRRLDSPGPAPVKT